MSESVLKPKGVFRRLLHMLRPHWGTIGVAVVLLLCSLPGELFPGLTWMYVTDALISGHETNATLWIGKLVSFNGHITGKFHLLLSAVVWMLCVYIFAESFS